MSQIYLKLLNGQHATATVPSARLATQVVTLAQRVFIYRNGAYYEASSQALTQIELLNQDEVTHGSDRPNLTHKAQQPCDISCRQPEADKKAANQGNNDVEGRLFVCTECPYVFTEAEISAEGRNVWGHPCHGVKSEPNAVCESYRETFGPMRSATNAQDRD